ncbi:MAG: hypothetical protein BWZ10_02947 [candidate division BRC1 bacterium ADurb.BinA364]|nr:MAG: hypothetical protein BWZ10_02947 [candidate division BRC1 bacterium ADurb.BinA364]
MQLLAAAEEEGFGERADRFRRGVALGQGDIEIVAAAIVARRVNLQHAVERPGRPGPGRVLLRADAVGHRRSRQPSVGRGRDSAAIDIMQAAHDMANHVRPLPELGVQIVQNPLAHLDQPKRPAVGALVSGSPLRRAGDSLAKIRSLEIRFQRIDQLGKPQRFLIEDQLFDRRQRVGPVSDLPLVEPRPMVVHAGQQIPPALDAAAHQARGEWGRHFPRRPLAHLNPVLARLAQPLPHLRLQAAQQFVHAADRIGRRMLE